MYDLKIQFKLLINITLQTLLVKKNTNFLEQNISIIIGKFSH